MTVRHRYSPAQMAQVLRLDPPTPEQAAVIAAPPGPLAVIAGAGSGKSETMAARLVWLVANGHVLPERVLGLTFTRKAAAELAERVRSRLDSLRQAGLPGLGADELAGEPVIATYHAYAGRLVCEHAAREGVEPSVRLVTPAVAWQIAARVVAAYDGPMDEVEWTPVTVTAAVIQLAGELAEHLRVPANVLATGDWLDRRWAERAQAGLPLLAAARQVLSCQRTRERLLPLVEFFQAAKAEREVIDYADQMALAARIARRHRAVSVAERARYQAVLLDEYQDTSHAQLMLLRSLFGGGHPVTAVGDPCQSIYGWRGASAGNLLRFSRDFRQADGRPAPVLPLSVSFRNTGRVLAAAGRLQADLRAASTDVPRLSAPPARSHRGEVVCALLETAEAEAEWVAVQVERLLALPPGVAPDCRPWLDGRPDGIHPRDIAVLCRRRSQFPALRAGLEARGIPVEVVGLGGLLTVPEVADIVATLNVLHDPAASPALARLLTSPRWRIGPTDLVALGRRARALAAQEHTDFDAALSGAREQSDAVAQALDRAVADLTRDRAGLVEALGDLGDPAAYTPTGHARLCTLAAELHELRSHLGRPLPELVVEVERTLGLDIEVAARPGVDPASARADLDAFVDAAAAFAGDQHEPTLGAFLAYLEAAETEEFGLETGRVGESDSVKLATVHSAKGLEWAAVFVPGLCGRAGPGSLFPARPKYASRWTANPRLLPFSLRGDRADLPELAGLGTDELAGFERTCAARDLAEERRLAYVAATRAAFWLGCSGYWWGTGRGPLGPSVFLEEVRSACTGTGGTVDAWTPEPAAEAENPVLCRPPTALWPVRPSGDQLAEIRKAAGLVGDAAGLVGDAAGPVPEVADPPGPVNAGQYEPAATTVPARYRDLVAGWARDADLLLAEATAARRARQSEVPLPSWLSVSRLVTLARDPAALARQVRRPMPCPPTPKADRGTEFHRWLEARFTAQRLVDPDDLPGARDDDDPADVAGADLAELMARFEAGGWARRWPADVEVPFQTVIGGRVITGRIDAVFSDAPDGRFDVVDWKTGAPPTSDAERAVVSVQLAAYRLAWAQLAGVPLAEVRAAFYYVREDLTVRPADLLDETGLAALLESVPARGAAGVSQDAR